MWRQWMLHDLDVCSGRVSREVLIEDGLGVRLPLANIHSFGSVRYRPIAAATTYEVWI